MKNFTIDQIKGMYLSSEITTPSKISNQPDGMVLLDRGRWSNDTFDTYLMWAIGDCDAEHHGYVNSPIFLSGFKTDLITKKSENEYLISGIEPFLLKQKTRLANLTSRKEWEKYAKESGEKMFSRSAKFFGTKSYTNMISFAFSDKLPVAENFTEIIAIDDYQNTLESFIIKADEKIVPLYYSKVK